MPPRPRNLQTCPIVTLNYPYSRVPFLFFPFLNSSTHSAINPGTPLLQAGEARLSPSDFLKTPVRVDKPTPSPCFPPRASSSATSSDVVQGRLTRLGRPCNYLHLLGTPAGIGLSHVGRRLDGRDEFQDDVADADEANDGARDDAQHAIVQQDRADKDVESAATDKGEQEGGIARDLGWDLELEEAGGYK